MEELQTRSSDLEQEQKNDILKYEESGSKGLRRLSFVCMIFGSLLLLFGIICLFSWGGRSWHTDELISGLICVSLGISSLISIPLLKAIATIAEAAHIYKKKEMYKMR